MIRRTESKIKRDINYFREGETSYVLDTYGDLKRLERKMAREFNSRIPINEFGHITDLFYRINRDAVLAIDPS